MSAVAVDDRQRQAELAAEINAQSQKLRELEERRRFKRAGDPEQIRLEFQIASIGAAVRQLQTEFAMVWNAVQVQRWRGHHKPSFTLDVYIHSLPKNVIEPTFMDAILAGEVGNDGQQRASSAPESTGDSVLTVAPQEVAISRENLQEAPVLSSAANDF